ESCPRRVQCTRSTPFLQSHSCAAIESAARSPSAPALSAMTLPGPAPLRATPRQVFRVQLQISAQVTKFNTIINQPRGAGPSPKSHRLMTLLDFGEAQPSSILESPRFQCALSAMNSYDICLS